MTSDLPDALLDHLRGAGLDVETGVPLPGDVSPRRYYRVVLADGATAVVAVYPDSLADRCAVWLRTTEVLVAHDVPVPEVLAADCARHWIAVEDVGEHTLAESFCSWETCSDALDDAVEIAGRISSLDTERVDALNPRLGSAALRSELRQTSELVLTPGRLVPPPFHEELERTLDALVGRLDEATPRPCHRDFMARNLVPREPRARDEPALVVLDHQDLRLGPPCYDLASLLNDTFYVSAELEADVLDRLGAGSAFREAYHRAAAQRCLKIAGTFEAFRRRGHDRHVPLIAPSLAAARRHLLTLPETAAVARELPPWDDP